MQQTTEEWLKTIPPDKGHYFAGFTDGEGSFNVSVRKRHDHQIGWQTELCLNVSQKEEYILAQFKKLLGCGRLQRRKDGVCYYVVVNPRSIMERVIPFFERFPFLSLRKKRNFMIFKQIAQMVHEKQHLDRAGLQKIMELREILNEGKGRTRKYALQDYEQFCQENPQRLHVRHHSSKEENEEDIVRSA